MKSPMNFALFVYYYTQPQKIVTSFQGFKTFFRGCLTDVRQPRVVLPEHRCGVAEGLIVFTQIEDPDLFAA